MATEIEGHFLVRPALPPEKQTGQKRSQDLETTKDICRKVIGTIGTAPWHQSSQICDLYIALNIHSEYFPDFDNQEER